MATPTTLRDAANPERPERKAQEKKIPDHDKVGDPGVVVLTSVLFKQEGPESAPVEHLESHPHDN